MVGFAWGIEFIYWLKCVCDVCYFVHVIFSRQVCSPKVDSQCFFPCECDYAALLWIEGGKRPMKIKIINSVVV